MQQVIAERAKSVAAARRQGKKLQFLPILGRSHEEPRYELLRPETLPSVAVTEISEGGSVPQLRVENKLNVAVFLMDGQELVGAKQNRILNTDVLVPAHGTLVIPVSCVEQGRWHRVSKAFNSGKSASHHVRAGKLSRVHASLKTGSGHDAIQSAVWAEVEMSHAAAGTSSPTMALNDAYAQRKSDLTDVRKGLRMPAKAVGLAVFQGGRFQGMDLFDRHSTLKYFWESLVDSYAIDLLEVPVDPSSPASDEAQVVRFLLDRIAGEKWEGFAPPGEGREWRVETADLAAAALVWNDEVVLHLQVFPKLSGGEGGTSVYRPRIRCPHGPIGS